jgi:hypothetical protein
MGRKSALRVIGTCLLIASVLTVSWLAFSNTSAKRTAERLCNVSSLSVNQTSSGGLGHAWLILIFRNTSNTGCKIFGYPSITVQLGSGPFSNQNGAAKRSKPGSTVRAIDQIDIYGGGLSGSVANQRLTLPVVSLKPNEGWASSIIGWSPEGGGKACPWFRSFTLAWRGSQVNLRTGPSPLCGQIDVTPIVPGNTGDYTESG